jgi:hypothetical protein
MRKIALLVFALCLLCWRPSPASTQPLPQAANFQDRDDHRDQDRRDGDQRDADRHDADRHDGDRRDADRHDDDRDHFRDRSNNWDRNRYPRGSYARTCRDIRMEGDSLRASCQKNDSRWRDTTLRHAASCQGQLINDNGRLRCM